MQYHEQSTGKTPPTMTGEILTVKEVAQKLKYSESGIYKLVEKSRIPHYKLPGGAVRFNTTAIEQWLEKRTVKSKS